MNIEELSARPYSELTSAERKLLGKIGKLRRAVDRYKSKREALTIESEGCRQRMREIEEEKAANQKELEAAEQEITDAIAAANQPKPVAAESTNAEQEQAASGN